jgi:hypothetical protein
MSLSATLNPSLTWIFRTTPGNRGKSRGGMILRFTGGRESDSFWACRRLPMLTAFRTPI